MPDITKVLSDETLHALRLGYDRDVVVQMLEKVVPDQYDRAQPYFSAVVGTFFKHEPALISGVRVALDVQDRQRCIIALQAATGQVAPLAIHIYISLMERITVSEIANVLLLAGVYTGVPNFFTGMGTLETTLEAMAECAAAGQTDPPAVLHAVQEAFKVQREPEAPVPAAAPPARTPLRRVL
jgi:alkylhydroperoxidase/carboxymuconolactone decarboxylase family protein YurZ